MTNQPMDAWTAWAGALGTVLLILIWFVTIWSALCYFLLAPYLMWRLSKNARLAEKRYFEIMRALNRIAGGLGR